jgi:hypothetical protein
MLGRVDVPLAAVLLDLGGLGLFAATLHDLASRSRLAPAAAAEPALEAKA